jgi:hypothetical protein
VIEKDVMNDSSGRDGRDKKYMLLVRKSKGK